MDESEISTQADAEREEGQRLLDDLDAQNRQDDDRARGIEALLSAALEATYGPVNPEGPEDDRGTA